MMISRTTYHSIISFEYFKLLYFEYVLLYTYCIGNKIKIIMRLYYDSINKIL